MKPGLPFEPLLEAATRERDACARKTGEAKAFVDNAKQRLDMLQNHYAVTAASLAGKPGARTDGNSLRDARTFLSRLELAIRRQGDEVKVCENRVESARQETLAAEKRLRAFQGLNRRALDAEAKAEHRRDQALMDEFAARTPRTQPI